MLRLIAILLLLPATTLAQDRDSVFSDYASYARFVDQMIMTRNFEPLVLQLGGRDEYTPEQLASTNHQLLRAFPYDFKNAAVFRQTDLGGGMIQEGRVYWIGDSYAYYYAILHQRTDSIIVLSFNLNSSIGTIMDKF
jgi:hypothetical protein